MNQAFFTSFVLIAMTFCEISNGQIERLFARNEATMPVSGLVLEVALEKQTYFLGEPVTVCVRLRNVSKRTIAVVLEDIALESVGSRLSILCANEEWAYIGPYPQDNVCLIPENTSFYFVLGGKIFPKGKTRFRVQYNHTPRADQVSYFGAMLWEGQIQSNEVEIQVTEKDLLTIKEKNTIEKLIRGYMRLLSSRDDIVWVQANHALRMMPQYSIPILLEDLTNPDERVKKRVLDTILQIAKDKRNRGLGSELDIQIVEKLIAGYRQEQDLGVKKRYLATIARFYGDLKKNQRVIQFMRSIIKNEEVMELRAEAAMSLLSVSKLHGLSELLDTGFLDDDKHFGPDGYSSVMTVIGRSIGLGPWADPAMRSSMTIDEVKRWFEQNKVKLEAEENAVREANQTEMSTSEETQSETNRTTGGR